MCRIFSLIISYYYFFFYQFNKGNTKHNSTNRVDFRNFGSYRPDVIVRRKAQMRNDGLGQEHIFHHHGEKYTQNNLSWYDEHYNGRYKENTLPSLRDWNGHKLSWAPEKSDHPLQGKELAHINFYGKFQHNLIRGSNNPHSISIMGKISFDQQCYYLKLGIRYRSERCNCNRSVPICNKYVVFYIVLFQQEGPQTLDCMRSYKTNGRTRLPMK